MLFFLSDPEGSNKQLHDIMTYGPFLALPILHYTYLADQGKARGCSTNSMVIKAVSKKLLFFLPHHVGAAIFKIDTIAQVLNILIPERPQHCFIALWDRNGSSGLSVFL